MAKKKGVDRRKVDKATGYFRLAVKGGEGSTVIKPEFRLAEDYREAGMNAIEAREAAHKELIKAKKGFENPNFPPSKRRIGLLGVREKRVNDFERHIQEAKKDEARKQYKREIIQGKHPKYGIGNKIIARDLEKQLVIVASILSLGAGFLFTSPNITGRAIGGVNLLDSSVIGVSFFILGLIGLLLCIKNQDN